MEAIPHGTVTFLFTDVEGSTRLWELSPPAMRDALAFHDQILRSAIDEHAGYVFSTAGDGFSAAFWTPGDAVEAAIDAQRRLGEMQWPEPVTLRVRMGLHCGMAEERDGDYFGPAVNRAARLMSLGHGGQILVSLAIEELVRDRLGATMSLVDLGEYDLSGLSRSERVFQLWTPGLPRDFPPLRTPTTGNLPSLMTRFVGRREQLEHLAEQLPVQRLLTLTGVGGVGKTRLAVEAAGLAARQFPDGVRLCELGAVAEAGAVAHAVATTLSIRQQDGLSIVDSVVDALRGQRRLLILDNCEHVLSAAALLCEAIGKSCPTVSVLATSREPLAIVGERVWGVPSLHPATEGVELFCDRAVAADASFSPTDSETTVIEGICERLDGIPLAIELAAARIRSMTPMDLADRLHDRFRVLRGGQRGRIERHQTLRATVQWSYQLLPHAEQVLFSRLSVFAGTFELAAAEAVGADNSSDRLDVGDLLSALVDKSMVVADRTGTHTRYRLLETLRQYAEEQLDASGGLAIRRDRHLEHFADLAHLTRLRYEGSDNLAAAQTFRSEWDNFRAAVHWAIANDDATAASQMVEDLFFFAAFGLRHELGAWAQDVLALLNARPVVYAVGAFFAVVGGQPPRGLELARAGNAADPAPGERGRWMCLWAEGIAAWYCGLANEAYASAQQLAVLVNPVRDPFFAAMAAAAAANYAAAPEANASSTYLIQARSIAAGLENPTLNTFIDWQEAYAARVTGNYHFALALLRRTLTLSAETQNSLLENMTALSIALLALKSNAVDIETTFADALNRLYTTRDWANIWAAIEALSLYWLRLGRLERASILFGHLEANNIRHSLFVNDRQVALATLGDVAAATHWLQEGAKLNRDELIDYALHQLTDR